MKRNIYKLKMRAGGGGIGIGGIGIGIGDGIGLGEIGDAIPEGYQFYNIQIDRVSYYLACSNGDTLGSNVDHNLRAYDVS
jgi:hypothetical protein